MALELSSRSAQIDPPMTFKIPDTDSTFSIWTTYYKNLNAVIPEGEPGLNPGSMSRSPFIEIVHEYGMPSLGIQ